MLLGTLVNMGNMNIHILTLNHNCGQFRRANPPCPDGRFWGGGNNMQNDTQTLSQVQDWISSPQVENLGNLILTDVQPRVDLP